MGAGRIAWPGRWKVSDDGSVVELIQKRIDDQTAWILGGCIGPDPLAGRPIGPTYGQVMASESLTFAKLQETWAAEVRKLRDERDKLRDQLRDVLAQMQPEPEQVKPKPRFVVEFAADVMTGLTTPANLENPGLVTIIHEFKPITPDKLVFLRDVFYEACGGNLDTRGIEGITAVLRKLGYECL